MTGWGFPADRVKAGDQTPVQPAEPESEATRRRGRRNRDGAVPAIPSHPEPALDTPASDDNP